MFPNIHDKNDSETKTDIIILVMRLMDGTYEQRTLAFGDFSNCMPDAVIGSRLHLVDFVLDYYTNASRMRKIIDYGLFVCVMTLSNAIIVHGRTSTFLQLIC